LKRYAVCRKPRQRKEKTASEREEFDAVDDLWGNMIETYEHRGDFEEW
jgi:hypothetical protein